MTVLPAPVARLIPSRRFPSATARRHASTHSSWYGRRGRGAAGLSDVGGISRVISVIFGGFLPGFTGAGRALASVAAIGGDPATCSCGGDGFFLGRPLLGGSAVFSGSS